MSRTVRLLPLRRGLLWLALLGLMLSAGLQFLCFRRWPGAPMFDLGYSITCRDATLAVGKIYKLRDNGSAAQRIAADRADRAICSGTHKANLADLGAVDVTECKLKDADVVYRAYTVHRGRFVYAAQGLGGYDSALQLALRSLVADQAIKGEISIATTGAGDPAAFARGQSHAHVPARAADVQNPRALANPVEGIGVGTRIRQLGLIR